MQSSLTIQSSEIPNHGQTRTRQSRLKARSHQDCSTCFDKQFGSRWACPWLTHHTRQHYRRRVWSQTKWYLLRRYQRGRVHGCRCCVRPTKNQGCNGFRTCWLYYQIRQVLVFSCNIGPKENIVTQVWCGLLATQPGKLAPHFHWSRVLHCAGLPQAVDVALQLCKFA